MKRRLFMSFLIIAMVAAAITGGTLAWFTASDSITPNVFTAGTVQIEAGESWAVGYEVTNWNPGDCEEKEVWVEITGTKRAYVRMQYSALWYENTAAPGDPEVWVLLDPQPVGAPLANPVIIRSGVDLFPDDVDDWVMVDDWYYYVGIGDPLDSLAVITEVCLDGPSAGNNFQGLQLQLGFNFEAIQVTHEAVMDEWDVGFGDIGGAAGDEWFAVVWDAGDSRWENVAGNWYWDGTTWIEVI